MRNVSRYKELRVATNRLLRQLRKIGGYILYTGEQKITDPTSHQATESFKNQLLQAIRKMDRFCVTQNATFMVVLDEQQSGDDWRRTNVEACTLAMFEDAKEKCRTLIEPPLQGESHLFQTLQCADWVCGLVGRLTAFSVLPEEYSDWEIFHRYFHRRLHEVALLCSGLEPQRQFPIPAEQAIANHPLIAGEAWVCLDSRHHHHRRYPGQPHAAAALHHAQGRLGTDAQDKAQEEKTDLS